MKKKAWIGLPVFVLLAVACYVLYRFNYIPHKKYTNADFDISPYSSTVDRDADGTDDQTDFLRNVRRYVATHPKYKSQYYANGYPDDGYGVCTDVVAFGLRGAGYDLKALVSEHIRKNPNLYDESVGDANIDFRRVKNLKVYLDNTAKALTPDIASIGEWQGGDIVVFKNHIGVVSDHRNRKGIPFVIHHANPYQLFYEEDILEQRDDIVGHYRIS